MKENLLFHSVIHEAAASDRLAALIRKVIEIPLVYKSFYWYSPEQKLISQHYHRQLTRAMRLGDGERAELIMKEHVLEARDFLLAELGPGDEEGRHERALVPARRAGPPRDVRAGPLAGIRVLELGMLLAGPFTGRLLGDMGAEIIKVEPPGKPDPLREWGKARYKGRSLWWGVQSRNKKCVTLDLRTERARSSCSSSPGRATWSSRTSGRGRSRSGISAGRAAGGESRARPLPRLRLRADGALRPRAGFASVAEAMGGLRHLNGFPGEPPPRLHLSLGDSLAGMFAAQGILALYRRDALGGGRGQVVDVSLLESCFALLESTVPEYDRLGIVRGPAGPGSRAPFEHLPVAGRQVDGDRGERRQRLPAALRGDGLARAGRRRALRHAPRARRAPGGDRGDHRRVGRPTRRRRSTASSTRRASSAGRSTRSPTSSRTTTSAPARCWSSTKTPSSAYIGPGIVPKFSETPGRSAGRRRGSRGATTARSSAACSASPTRRLAELKAEGVL